MAPGLPPPAMATADTDPRARQRLWVTEPDGGLPVQRAHDQVLLAPEAQLASLVGRPGALRALHQSALAVQLEARGAAGRQVCLQPVAGVGFGALGVEDQRAVAGAGGQREARAGVAVERAGVPEEAGRVGAPGAEGRGPAGHRLLLGELCLDAGRWWRRWGERDRQIPEARAGRPVGVEAHPPRRALRQHCRQHLPASHRGPDTPARGLHPQPRSLAHRDARRRLSQQRSLPTAHRDKRRLPRRRGGHPEEKGVGWAAVGKEEAHLPGLAGRHLRRHHALVPVWPAGHRHRLPGAQRRPGA